MLEAKKGGLRESGRGGRHSTTDDQSDSELNLAPRPRWSTSSLVRAVVSSNATPIEWSKLWAMYVTGVLGGLRRCISALSRGCRAVRLQGSFAGWGELMWRSVD